MHTQTLIIQEAGQHLANRNFREALSLSRAFKSIGHSSVVWGRGYDGPPIDQIGFDQLILLEQYNFDWLPDLSRIKCPKYMWSVDAHCNLQKHNDIIRRHGIDHVLSSTAAYLNSFDVPATWFPNCYDDTLINRPMIPIKRHDVGFCGNVCNRGPWLQNIHQHIGIKLNIMTIGRLMVEAIQSYRIHFNRNISEDINYRTYETLGCGTMLLTNHTDRLEDLFTVGTHLVTYEDREDCIEKIRYYLDNPTERADIAYAGHMHALQNHTYVNRAKYLIDSVFT